MADKKAVEFKVWYRPQFLNNVCHICKSTPDANSVVCPDCSLVSYCGKAHYEADMENHEDICEAFREAAHVLGTQRPHDKAYLLGPEQWREFRLGIVSMCSKYLGRPLVPWEMEICLYPPSCSTCHKICSASERCPLCFSTSWCTPNHKHHEHSKHCGDFVLFREILRRKVQVIRAPDTIACSGSMNTLMPAANRDEVVFSLLTEIATSPLTILASIPEFEDVVVDVVGPEPHFEANNIVKWEIFLFDLKTCVKNLTLNFVGPEMVSLPTRSWKKNDRTLTLNFHQVLYHEFVAQQRNHKPTMICAFNPGLYRPHGFDGMDSWAETINVMFRYPKVPVLTTAYTQKEVNLDYERILKQVPSAQVIVKPSRNPFSSLRPLMNFVSDEVTPIVFKNAYYTILTV